MDDSVRDWGGCLGGSRFRVRVEADGFIPTMKSSRAVSRLDIFHRIPYPGMVTCVF